MSRVFTSDVLVFLFLSTLYRLCAGALVVTLTWTIFTQDENAYFPLALAIFCSFIPAFVTPFIIKRLVSKFSGRRMTCIFLVFLAWLSLLVGLFQDATVVLLIINLLCWLFFLLLEASLDMWFTKVQFSIDDDAIRRVSGATTASGQAALMAGPLAAALLIPILSESGFFAGLAVAFLTVASFCYKRLDSIPTVPRQSKSMNDVPKMPVFLFIPMALVWPILGGFNFMLPIFVFGNGWSLFELGVLDAAFGMGMAVIGVIISTTSVARNTLLLLGLLLLLAGASVFSWSFTDDALLTKSASLVLLGLAFGGMRTHIRAIIASRYSEAEVGMLVSRANGWATPVVLLVLSLQMQAIEVAWLVPFLMIMLGIAFLFNSSAVRVAS